MKAYYEYEDGTFWAIRTAGGDCFTAEGSKYKDIDPESMQRNETVTEQEAILLAAEKSVSATRQKSNSGESLSK
jgi:hypothetical protein